MAEYVLDHHLDGERARLSLMSRLLDPMHRRHLESVGVHPGARALEVGCGNGSISAWLADRLGPAGQVVAVVAALGLLHVAGTAETAVYNGGSPWASYWVQTVTELRDRLVHSGKLDEGLVDGFLARCADPQWWTQTIAFTAVHGQARGA